MTALVLVLAATMSGPPSVSVTGDGGCLEPAALIERTQTWAGREAWPDRVVVSVEHVRPTLTIRVGAPGIDPVVRTFTAVPEACHDVELMAAVAIAMAIDAVELAADQAVDEVIEQSPPAARAPPIVTLENTAWSVRPARPTLSLVVAAGGGRGVVPFASGEAAFGLRLAWRRVALVAELELGARRVGAFDRDGSLGIVRVAPMLGVCSPWARGRWSIGLCALTMAGPMLAQTRDTAAPGRAVVPWFAVAARTEVGLDLSPRWALIARSDLVVGVVRPTIAATDLDTGQPAAWTTPRFGFRAALGVRVRLGRIPPGPVKRQASGRMQGSG